jgi:hypothetical protein
MKEQFEKGIKRRMPDIGDDKVRDLSCEMLKSMRKFLRPPHKIIFDALIGKWYDSKEQS